MRIPLTFPQVEQKVRELVAAHPDFVYPKIPRDKRMFYSASCIYNPTGNQPACIFGQAFIALGYPIAVSQEGNSIGEIMLDTLADGENLTDRDMYWANTMQVKQDNGKPWSVALAGADERRESYDEHHKNEEDDEPED